MSLKKVLVIAAASFLLSPLAYANVTVRLMSPDNCDSIIGSWAGSGTIKDGWIKCEYSGNGIATGSAEFFNMHIILNKKSGMFCPNDETYDLPGECHNGQLTLKTDSADLKGNLNEAGTEADVTGTVSFDVLGHTITADADVRLKKQ